jgi:transmembrane sensor
LISGTDENSGTGGAAEAAAGWFARLQGEAATGDDWLAFERWLQASPAHARAYERLERLWVDLDYAPVARDLGGRPLLAARRRLASRGAVGRPGRRAWIGATAAVAAGLVVAVGAGLWSTPRLATQTYQTGPGETRQIALADGTRIRLNAASNLTVSLGRDARRVRMADAEAVFDVAHDTARPFLITVGDRQVRVVGTEFNLRHRADKVALTVRRGVVEVRPAGAPQAEPTRVTVGQVLTHTDGEPGSILRVSDPQAAFAWTRGQLIYRDQPLSDVAADLSRRFGAPVRTADARTAALRFSGVLVTDSQPDVLRRLQAFVPVRVEQAPGAIVLHSR